MIRRTLWAILGVALLGGTASAQQVSLTGAGATFPYPMYSKWFDEYHKKVPNVQINYQSIGSGGGIQQVTEGTVDFGASDGPMNDKQLAEFQDKHGFPVIHFPTVMGADVPVYNIPGVTAQLNFTQDALAGIFLGTIKKWNDPAITSMNPRRETPQCGHRCGASFRRQRNDVLLDGLSFEGQQGVGKQSGQGNVGAMAGGARRQRQ